MMSLLICAIAACGNDRQAAAQDNPEGGETAGDVSAAWGVTTPDQLPFVPLNPARGDASPQAGVLWGDIRANVPSGVFLRFADGFTSPPHIHNITYRAIVIDGEIHNDDPDAARLWMPTGSYWVQPAGEDHITAARPGAPGMAFLEILSGPYLVQPSTEAFDNGERAINIVPDNMVWLSATSTSWLNDGSKAEIAFLWHAESPEPHWGTLLRLPAGTSGRIASVTAGLRAVVIEGDLTHSANSVNSSYSTRTDAGPGTYFWSTEDTTHVLACSDEVHCLIYFRTSAPFRFD